MRGAWLGAAAAVGGLGYRLVAEGRLTVDLGLGRHVRPLGPLTVDIRAPRQIVYDVIAEPYLERTPRALQGEIEVLERGKDMVLAAHRTAVGWGMVATTVETVRFTAPESIDFRLLRGPVPHVVERFALRLDGAHTTFEYRGEIGADLWAAGRWWADQVGRRWEETVAASVERIKVESERRAQIGSR